MDILQSVKDVVEDTDIAIHVSCASFITGMAHALEWIPDNPGKIAAWISIIFLPILSYFRLKKMITEIRLMKAEAEEIEKHNGKDN